MKDDNLEIAAEVAFAKTFAGEIDIIDQELTDSTIRMLFSGSEIASNLPIVKVIVGIAKMGVSVKDLLFAKKLLRVLQISSKISSVEREKFVEKIENDKKYRTKVGETYISYIEKARDIENAEQIAYLSNACVKGKMSYDDFLRCVNVVLTVSSGGLRDFILLDRGDISETSMDELIYSGLYRIVITPIKIDVKDDEELKQEAEAGKMKQPFSMSFEDLACSFNRQLEDVFNFSSNFPAFTREQQGKYHSTVNGGNVDFRISKIGEVIKEVLSDYYNNR